jgi:hypothetical protein
LTKLNNVFTIWFGLTVSGMAKDRAWMYNSWSRNGRHSAATWLVARDISQRAEPDVRPLDRADSAFITERTRHMSTLLTSDVPPQHLLRPVHSTGRRRQGHLADDSPVQSIVETVRPCCTMHCAHHPLYEKLPPAHRGYADLGCQGTRRLPQQ